MKLTVNTFLTLDGVMQGPGDPQEDPSHGFERGGWLVAYADEQFGAIVDGWFTQVDAFLLGRTTHDLMQGYWPQVTDPGNPVAVALNGLPKYVPSTTVTESSWANTSIITGDLVEAVSALKAQPGRELQVHGSWQLARALHEAGLVDEYRLLVFPVVVGPGKRLFDHRSTPTGFDVVRTETTTSGLVHHVLRPTAVKDGGTFVVEEGREVTVPPGD
jgi:dihydrofolate reductase